MKKMNYFLNIAVLLGMVFTFSSCSDSDSDNTSPVETSWVDEIESMTFVSANSTGSVEITEGKAVDITYQVVPAELAAMIAAQSGEAMQMVPHTPSSAQFAISQVTADNNGMLTLTVVPSGTGEAVEFLYALMLREGVKTFLADDVLFYKQASPVSLPSLPFNATQVSQTLAE